MKESLKRDRVKFHFFFFFCLLLCVIRLRYSQFKLDFFFSNFAHRLNCGFRQRNMKWNGKIAKVLLAALAVFSNHSNFVSYRIICMYYGVRIGMVMRMKTKILHIHTYSTRTQTVRHG